ncbi:hypothetical protein ACMFMG_007404 [Clarireedia jacksonii]
MAWDESQTTSPKATSSSKMSSSYLPLTAHRHVGPMPTPSSRQHPALRFLEFYVEKINGASYEGSYLPYYHPEAVFHDATGVDYVGGAEVWTWIRGLFGAGTFERIEMEAREFFVVGVGGEEGGEGNEIWKIYGEWLARWWVKGSGEVIEVPRGMVFTLGKAEGESGKEKGGKDANGDLVGEVGFEGLQIRDVKLWYDRSLLMGIFKRSEQEKKKFGV